MELDSWRNVKNVHVCFCKVDMNFISTKTYQSYFGINRVCFEALPDACILLESLVTHFKFGGQTNMSQLIGVVDYL